MRNEFFFINKNKEKRRDRLCEERARVTRLNAEWSPIMSTALAERKERREKYEIFAKTRRGVLVCGAIRGKD